MIDHAPKNMMESAAQAPAKAPVTRPGTKQDVLLGLLTRPEGATLVQICEAAGWQPQTARGWMANTVRSRLNKTVTTEHIGNGRKIYRIPGGRYGSI